MSKRLRKLAEGQECQVRIPHVCNFDPSTVVLAHMNGAGWGLKHHDLLGAHCCSACHDAVDGRSKEYLAYGHSSDEIKLWFYEGIFRTQLKLINEGKVVL